MSRRAVFLDRDGTLIRERGFVVEPAQVEVLPGAVEALHRLARAGFALVVVTNQSGIARGLYTEGDLARIHESLHESLDRLPAGYFHCPHHPEFDGPYGGECTCRKPGAGLLHQAVEVLGLEMEGSYMVGDSARDLLAARGLPLSTVLVSTGLPWRQQLAALEEARFYTDRMTPDLGAAASWILEREPEAAN